MSTYDRYGAPRRKKKKKSVFAPLSLLLIVVAVVFGLGVFFRVQNISVEGATSYTDEEIIEASGIDVGDNLFFINRFSASSQIFSRLPFVESATIERSLPNRIVIHVEESYAVAYLAWEDQSWMLTSSCKLLGSGTPEELEGLIHILHVEPLSPEAGELMTVDSGEELKLSYLKELLGAMETYGMEGAVSEIDMENAADPTFRYEDRFTVKMGVNDNTDYKIRMFLSALEQMDEYITGTVDLSETTAVYVSPD